MHLPGDTGCATILSPLLLVLGPPLLFLGPSLFVLVVKMGIAIRKKKQRTSRLLIRGLSRVKNSGPEMSM